jgi:hypothetical protein
LLLTFSGAGASQAIRPPAVPARADSSPVTTEPDEGQRRLAHEMAKKANLERQAQLKSDTDKLFKLSQELKEYVDQSNENVLSLNVLRKAEAIEKLARSVKDKMKGPN